MNQKDKCPWQYVGADIKNNIYWCENCGAILYEGFHTEIKNPLRIDQETYLCPDQDIKA